MQTCNFCRVQGLPDNTPHLIHYRTYCGISFWTCKKCHVSLMIQLNKARRGTVERFQRESLESHNKATGTKVPRLALHDKLESMIGIAAENDGVVNVTTDEFAMGIAHVDLLVRKTLKEEGKVTNRYLGFIAQVALYQILHDRALRQAEKEKGEINHECER